MLDWDDFRVFLSLARAGTLSAAARVLHVNQSTMSRRLAALEAAAGVRLFERAPAGYALSAAGEAVRNQVEQLEACAIGIERQLLGQDARPTGRVRLAASDSFAAWFLLPRLADFHRLYPGIELELFTGNQPVDLSRREADISLRMSRPKEPHLVARRLGHAPWAVYGSPSYLALHGKPSPRGRLRGHLVVAGDAELSRTVGARWLAKHGNSGKVVLRCNTLISQAAAALAGIGLCPLPCLCGDREPGLVRALPRAIGGHEVWLVVHPDVKSSARVRAVMAYVAELVTSAGPPLFGSPSPTR